MPKFESLKYRTCTWCGVQSVAMTVIWSSRWIPREDSGDFRSWAIFMCPRCAGVILVELEIMEEADTHSPQIAGIASSMEVEELQVIPQDSHQRYQVDHLPDDVSTYLSNSVRVLNAGVPDAAAVQLRKTLEAAAAFNGIQERTLVRSIEKLIEEGLIARRFGQAVHHIRKIGNIGAHYTDDRINRHEAELALKFTVELLRNLFEVPGELAAIEAQDQPPANGQD